MNDQQHIFELTVDAVPGAIERVLAVLRRRRLGLRSFRADRDEGGWTVLIRAGAIPQEAALALRQLTTLLDVRNAHLRDGPPLDPDSGLDDRRDHGTN